MGGGGRPRGLHTKHGSRPLRQFWLASNSVSYDGVVARGATSKAAYSTSPFFEIETLRIPVDTADMTALRIGSAIDTALAGDTFPLLKRLAGRQQSSCTDSLGP